MKPTNYNSGINPQELKARQPHLLVGFSIGGRRCRVIIYDASEHVKISCGWIYKGIFIMLTSGFWDLTNDDRTILLEDARRKIPYAMDCFLLEWVNANGSVPSGDIDELRDIMQAYDRLNDNPFASDKLKYAIDIIFSEVTNKPKRAPSSALRKEIIERDGYHCQYCGWAINEGKEHIDHVIPWSRGGETSFNNLVVSCRKCNARKGNKLLSETSMELWKKRVLP
jgi:hypothetical protein